VGRIDDDQYMAFGRSGRDDETFMEGADAVVADISLDGEFRARDLYMGVRAQCSAGTGVCPDGQFGFTDDATDVSGEADFGLTLIRYTRSLSATDVDAELELQSGGLGAIDRVISLDEDTFIVWAIGPLSPSNGFPNFHTIYPGSSGEDKDYSLNFGREVTDNCTPLVGAGGGETELAEPFERPVLGQGDNVVEFEAHIGLSGGPRGYLAISGGRTAWGISWYLNGYIVPELELRRGTTYRFLVNGGDDPAIGSVYHPLYITDSIAGGYAGLTAEERKQETVFAGLNILTETEQGVTEFEPTAIGPICSYTAGPDTMAAFENLSDYDIYFATLDSSCADDVSITSAAGVLEFTPDENTPDLLYYQCVTHQNLGWKINIVDAAPASAPVSVPVAVPVPAPLPAFTPISPPGSAPVAAPVPAPVSTGNVPSSAPSFQPSVADAPSVGSMTSSTPTYSDAPSIESRNATMAPNTPTAATIEPSNAPLSEDADASNIDDTTSGAFPNIHLYSALMTVATVLAIVVGL